MPIAPSVLNSRQVIDQKELGSREYISQRLNKFGERMGILTPKESEAMTEEISRAIRGSRQDPHPFLVRELTEITQRYARLPDASPSTQRRRRRKVVPPPAAHELLRYLSKYGDFVFDAVDGAQMDFGEWELRARRCKLPACQKMFFDTSPTWNSRPARFCWYRHRARFAKLPH